MRLWKQIGGTLTFFHGEGARRCLEVIVLFCFTVLAIQLLC